MPQTLGEANSAYTYIPIDPLPIFQEPGKSCPGNCDNTTNEENFKKLLESLPDQAVRLAIAQLNGKAAGSFGPASVGYESNSYQVILDYISVDATQLPIYVKRVVSSRSHGLLAQMNSSVLLKVALVKRQNIYVESLTGMILKKLYSQS